MGDELPDKVIGELLDLGLKAEDNQYSEATKGTLKVIDSMIGAAYESFVKAGLPNTEENKLIVYKEFYIRYLLFYGESREDGVEYSSHMRAKHKRVVRDMISKTGSYERYKELPEALIERVRMMQTKLGE